MDKETKACSCFLCLVVGFGLCDFYSTDFLGIFKINVWEGKFVSSGHASVLFPQITGTSI